MATSLLGTRQQIGGYRLVAPIGVGGSSTVYRALDEQTGHEVAIKVLADNHSLRPEMRQRFHDEVALLADISSPAVASIQHLGETDTGQPYMVLELADRGDLRRRIDELAADGVRLGPVDLVAVAEHLAEGLTALHEAGIVHRDVTPANVLIARGAGRGASAPGTPGTEDAARPGLAVLEPGERFLLTDLGFAKDLAYASGITAGGGTKGFAAPEQWDEITVVDRRSDIYSATALMEWAARGTGLVRELDPFFETGLAASPDDRFDSMDAWLHAFRRALGEAPPFRLTPAVADEPAAPVVTERPGRGARWAGRTAPVIAVAVAALVIAALAVGVALRPWAAEKREPVAQPTIASTTASTPASLPWDPAADAQGVAADRAGVGDAKDADTPATTAGGGQEAEAADGATTTSSNALTETTSAPTTAPATTVAPSATTPGVSTSDPSVSTTVDPRYVGSPRAFIQAPGDGATVSGDLVVSGVGQYDDGLRSVEITIRDLDDEQYWHDSTRSFERQWVRFPVEVTPIDGSDVSWSYTVAAGEIPPGRYEIRVWARATTGNGDPVSDSRQIIVVP